jgi:hypothetical protein
MGSVTCSQKYVNVLRLVNMSHLYIGDIEGSRGLQKLVSGHVSISVLNVVSVVRVGWQ